MKNHLKTITAIASFAALHSAGAIDITISDPHNDKSFANANLGPTGPENNTVQYNAIANQTWDLESFTLSGSSLSITGGFNFLTGKGTGSNLVFPMGDIFIYLGSEAPYSIPGGNLNDHNGPWAGRDNWDFAIQFDRGTDQNIRNSNDGIGYSIVANNGQAVSYTGGTGATLTGLPWLVTGATQPGDFGTFSTFGSLEGTHYSIGGLDLSSILAGGESFYLHATMRCGNDVLWGYQEGTRNVPDGGAAVAMLGLGIGAIGLMRRRVR
jgi:hypothetical protein